MKKYFLLPVVFFFCIAAVAAQQPIDEIKVEKAVELMKKMLKSPGEIMTIQAALKELKLNSAEDAEMRKRMSSAATQMISQGKQQAMKTGGITEQQISKTKEDRERVIPVKDEARINTVYKNVLTDAEIKLFCKAIHESVKKQLNAGVIEQSEKLYTAIRSKAAAPAAYGAAAVGAYIDNLTLQSIYVLGRVCSEESLVPENINNYAALLTNYGLEEGAIPLLSYLNRRYPKDPFVLNNLSMAWLGLGDLKTAEKYADSCIRYFPDRSHQAHYAKCVVLESEGNHAEATAELQQSIGQVYSGEKEAQLRKWGGKMSRKNYKRNIPPDALGVSKFKMPDFPKDYDAYFKLDDEWKVFHRLLDETINKLENQSRSLGAYANQYSQQLAMAKINQAMANGTTSSYAGNKEQQMGWWHFFNDLLLDNAMKEEDIRKEQKKVEENEQAMLDEMDAASKVLDNTYSGCETGGSCPEEAICKAYKSVYNKYMKEANEMLEGFWNNYIGFKRRKVNDEAYAAKRCLDNAAYEKFLVDKKLEFLRLLRVIRYKKPGYMPGFGGFMDKCIQVKQEYSQLKELPLFEDIHCPEKWSARFITTTVSTECNRIKISTEISLGPVSVSGSYSEHLLTGEFTNLTIEVGGGIGSIKAIGGIDEIEAGADAAGYIEIDRQGIADCGVKGGVSAGVKDIGQVSAGTKVSVMSGKPSYTAKGSLNKAGKLVVQTYTQAK